VTRLLLVVDLQNGFVNDNTRPILSNVNRLIEAFSGRGEPIAFTRFVNTPGSGYERWIGWSRFMSEPENALSDEIDSSVGRVFIKHAYTAFTEEFASHLNDLGVERLVICGIATDGCVLKSAVDAFERGIEPLVVSDACASHAGVAVHDAGLMLIGRFIGAGQLKPTEDFV
jgi:nicotinamidase-related amidase